MISRDWFGSRSSFFERHAEAFELFVFEANSDAELQTPAGDHIDYSNVLGKAYWIVKWHQEHARCDTDPFSAGGDGSGDGQNRGEVAVFDEMVLREPNVVESVVIAPCDLIEGCGVELVRGLVPLRWVSEIVPKTKAYFSTILTHGLTSPDKLPLL